MLRAGAFAVVLAGILSLAPDADASAPKPCRQPARSTQPLFGMATTRLRISQDIRLTCPSSTPATCDLESTIEVTTTNDEHLEVETAPLQSALGGPTAWTESVDGHEEPLPASLSLSARPTKLVGHTRLELARADRCETTMAPAALRHLLFALPDVERHGSIPVFSTSAPTVHVQGDVKTTLANGALLVERHEEGSLSRQGGPFVGAGSTYDKANDARVALRAGYEIARPSWVLWSASAETDLRSATLVPAVELATTHPWFGAMSLGTGAPIRITEPTVGVRVQGSVMFAFIGVVMAVDHFPALPKPAQNGLTIFAQLSL